jgi:tRNA-Thr(GGU) m(6)t(6)A37 methyltransferase TsaA
MPSSSSFLVPAIATTVLVVSGTISACSAAWYWWHQQQMAVQRETWQSLRQEERTGRIRAEVKLRTLVKKQQQQQQQQSNDSVQKETNGNDGDDKKDINTSNSNKNKKNSKNDGNDNNKNKKLNVPVLHMHMQSIGTIISPYTKRMGTPRQGALVPTSRGRIQFSCQTAALDYIDSYSHVWVVFEFHANTNTNNVRSKIRPPRAAHKVGTLATRSPHRPNALGLSLVVVDRWDAVSRELHISGLDLVHGTPVYDIKPCVPWDIPGYRGPNMESGTSVPACLKTPDWVQQDDALAKVEFRETAVDSLQTMVAHGRLAPLYTTENDGVVAARQTLSEVLAQDPRSSHKGIKENARGSTTAAPYNLIFGQCQVDFVVTQDNVVEVVAVTPIDFAAEDYVDGVPLISGTT